MATWTNDELAEIENEEELELASRRRDGGMRNPVTMWVVRDGNEVYVRSMHGRSGAWFQRTQTSHEGRIRAGGVEKEVTFAEADPAAHDRIDAAYRRKYRRYGESYVDPMTSPQVRAATIRLVPG